MDRWIWISGGNPGAGLDHDLLGLLEAGGHVGLVFKRGLSSHLFRCLDSSHLTGHCLARDLLKLPKKTITWSSMSMTSGLEVILLFQFEDAQPRPRGGRLGLVQLLAGAPWAHPDIRDLFANIIIDPAPRLRDLKPLIVNVNDIGH